MVANVNVLSMVQGELQREPIGTSLGKDLGVSEANVRKGLSAAVPTVLSRITQRASTPAGALEVGTIASQRSSLAYQLQSMAGGDNLDAVVDQGNQDLSRLIGDRSVVAIAGSVAGYANMSAEAATRLVGFVGPAILSVIGRIKQQTRLDDSGMSRLLTEQKAHVQRAIPTGFELDDDSRVSAASAGMPVRESGPGAPSSTRFLRIALPLALLALLGALAYRWIGTRSAPPVQRSGMNEQTYERANDVQSGLHETLGAITNRLARIHDPASAEAALPALAGLEGRLSSLRIASSNLPAAARRDIDVAARAEKARVLREIVRVRSIQGVSRILGPTLDRLWEDLSPPP